MRKPVSSASVTSINSILLLQAGARHSLHQTCVRYTRTRRTSHARDAKYDRTHEIGVCVHSLHCIKYEHCEPKTSSTSSFHICHSPVSGKIKSTKKHTTIHSVRRSSHSLPKYKITSSHFLQSALFCSCFRLIQTLYETGFVCTCNVFGVLLNRLDERSHLCESSAAELHEATFRCHRFDVNQSDK